MEFDLREFDLRLRALSLAFFLLSAALVGCPKADHPTDCAIGDPSLPIELSLVARTADGTIAPISEGGPVPLLGAPQGGYVLFVGPRARNLNGCGVVLDAVLRDPCTDLVVAIESRPVDLAKQADGFGVPFDPVDLTNFSNLSTCPSTALERTLDGEPYQLKLRLKDKTGKMAELSLPIVPRCVDSNCQCECSAIINQSQRCPTPEELDAGPRGCGGDGGLDAGGGDR